MAPKKSDVMTLSLNEKILCNASGIFYEAKVIEVSSTEDGEPKFLVHYQGWHKRYDEWIKQSDIPEKIKPFSDEGLAQAKAHLREAKASLNKRGRKRDVDELKESASRASTPSENADGSKAPSTTSEKIIKGRGTKRKAEDEPAKDPYPKKSDLFLQLPLDLKHILIEDADLINRQSKIYNLPARYTVEQIIKDFCQEVGLERSEQDRVMIEYEDGKTISQDAVQLIQSTRGVQDYFDSLLPFQLLYKLEKLQYSNVIEKEKREAELANVKKRGRSVPKPIPAPTSDAASELVPSKFYGFPHLLRLLTRFEYLLRLSVFNDRISASRHMFQSIMKGVSDFTVWLNKKKDVYYNPQLDYIVPPPDYQREAYA